MISNFSGINCTYSHFFNHQSLLQLSFGQLKKHASALAIQSNDNSKTFEWQGFSQSLCIRASHVKYIVGAQPEIQCLTLRTTWLVWRVWPRSLGLSVPAWQRHVKSSKLKNLWWKCHLCLFRRLLYTIQCHMTTLSGNLNWPRLPSWIRFFTAWWQWQHVPGTKHQSKHQRGLPAYIALQKIACYKRL